MINRHHPLLPFTQPSRLLRLSRSSLYYEPGPKSERDLRRMGKIDQLQTARPFAASKMLPDMLRFDGEKVGRKQVSTRMKKMRIEAL